VFNTHTRTHTNLRGAGGEELSDEGYCPKALNFLLVILVDLPEFRTKKKNSQRPRILLHIGTIARTLGFKVQGLGFI
jgi:hypothetical protein